MGIALAGVACSGKIVGTLETDPTAPPGTPHGPSSGGTGGGGGSGAGSGPVSNTAAGMGGLSSMNGGTGPTAGSGPSAAGDPAADVNRVPIHRLNNAEYDNTVSDLLGVSSKAGTAFIDDEKLFGFDNIAAAFGMSDARYEEYFNAADALVEEAFADDGTRKKLLVCTPKSDSDLDCAEKVLNAFMQRALRRPATDAELTRASKLVSDAVELGEDISGGIKQALKAILSSAPFLYRVELDPDPSSATPHALTAYELGSRLSYLVWSTMPDDELFEHARDGSLTSDDVLVAELERLLADDRAERFIASFGGQWLGFRALESHQVDKGEYPDWNDTLRAGMVAEGLSYFSEFVRGDRGLSEFFTADVNFVNAPLAKLYGVSAPSGDAMLKVTNTSDQRRGFLGLASFLTLTSFSKRTAPTLRGVWVLENLLCEHIEPPPASVPELDTGGDGEDASVNVRDRLAEHRKNPSCAGCHETLDPIGLGLENFDAIGKYRTTYAGGDAVDATGMLPSGEGFEGLLELSSLLAADDRLADCAQNKLLTYALSRELVASDTAYLRSIKAAWTADGLGLAALLEHVVTSETFRQRRGEP